MLRFDDTTSLNVQSISPPAHQKKTKFWAKGGFLREAYLKRRLSPVLYLLTPGTLSTCSISGCHSSKQAPCVRAGRPALLRSFFNPHQQRDREEEPGAPALIRREAVHRTLRRPNRHHDRQVPDKTAQYKIHNTTQHNTIQYNTICKTRQDKTGTAGVTRRSSWTAAVQNETA